MLTLNRRKLNELLTSLHPGWTVETVLDSANSAIEVGQGVAVVLQASANVYAAQHATSAAAGAASLATTARVLPASYELSVLETGPSTGWLALRSLSGNATVRWMRVPGGVGSLESFQLVDP